MKKKTIFFMTFGSCEFCNKVINFLGPQNSSPYKKGQFWRMDIISQLTVCEEEQQDTNTRRRSIHTS